MGQFWVTTIKDLEGLNKNFDDRLLTLDHDEESIVTYGNCGPFEGERRT